MKKFLLLLSMAACMGFVACSDDDADDNNDPKKDDNGEEIIDNPQETTHDYVDLGLPSGTQWAVCNLGANNPWDYGDYFAWGETKPKVTYDENDYKFFKSNDDGTITITKYVVSDFDEKKNFVGEKDGIEVLEDSDDAARQILGNGWSIPTKEQWEELMAKCVMKDTTLHNIDGVMMISRKDSEKSVFFPCSGITRKDVVDGEGLYGGYWSSTMYTDPYYSNASAYQANIYGGSKASYSSCVDSKRANGLTIRAVRSK